MPATPPATPPADPSPPAPREHVEIRPAPAGFEDTVVCAIWRTLDAAPGLSHVDSIVPANAYACLNIITAGEIRLDPAHAAPLPPIFLTGPFTAPLQTYAVAPLHSLSLVLQPWLLPAWFGQASASLVDTLVEGARIERLQDAALVASLQQATLDPASLEQALRLLGAPGAPGADDAMTLAATLSATPSIAQAAEQLGIGVRQLERRFKRLFGLSPKQWLQMKRFESSLTGLGRDDAPLIEVSNDAGYADQSHMTREYRRAATYTPAQTRHAIHGSAPGFWAFKPAKSGVKR